MSNIDAFLQSKFNIGLLTDEKIDYDDYNNLALSDEYEYQSDMEFWNVREGPNAKQTVSPSNLEQASAGGRRPRRLRPRTSHNPFENLHPRTALSSSWFSFPTSFVLGRPKIR